MQQADSGQVVLESTTAPRTKKRARAGDGDGEDDTATYGINNCTKNKAEPSPPPYGSQAYWEERYQAQFAAIHSCSDSSSPSSSSPSQQQQQQQPGGGEKETTTLAYHSWYFTYDELRPLLLPLLLGGREMARHVLQLQLQQEGDEAGDEGDDEAEDADEACYDQEKYTNSEHQGNEPENENGSDDDASDDDDDDDETGVPDRDIGLAEDGPVAILELGCGDVPLGASLALELNQLEQTITATRADRIVSQILCTDSSPTVIAAMRQQYNCHPSRPDQETNRDKETTTTTTTTSTIAIAEAPTPAVVPSEQVMDIGDVPLEFATADARHLPYADQQFAMVLEKGTLDAVLSDTTHGSRDCIAIVAEAARVLRPGGCLVLVSHLNAHTPNGLSWLEQVVFAGLQKQQRQQPQNGPEITWEIEVHGHDEVMTQQEDEDEENEDEELEQDEDGGASSTPSASRLPPNSAGPAVYIIHKMSAMAPTGKTVKPTMVDPEENSSTKTIPVKFFTY